MRCCNDCNAFMLGLPILPYPVLALSVLFYELYPQNRQDDIRILSVVLHILGVSVLCSVVLSCRTPTGV